MSVSELLPRREGDGSSPNRDAMATAAMVTVPVGQHKGCRLKSEIATSWWKESAQGRFRLTWRSHRERRTRLVISAGPFEGTHYAPASQSVTLCHAGDFKPLLGKRDAGVTNKTLFCVTMHFSSC